MSLTDEAIAKIKAMIIDGKLRPGDKLPPEQELASSLGLSRSSMREAVKALEVIRVLDVRRGDGTYVTSLEPAVLLEAIAFVGDVNDNDSLLEIFAVRRVLEAHATGIAAHLATADDIATLEAELGTVDTNTSVSALVEHDARFHSSIVSLTGNQYLASLVEGLSSQIVRARVWRGLSESDAVERTLGEHHAIVAAIRSGDGDLAQALATAHVAGVESWLSRVARAPRADA